MPDYSQTVIYKIVCKDKAITDFYVGHTTDLTRRENTHLSRSSGTNEWCYTKLYEFIRANGGWTNFEMQILDHFINCQSKEEAITMEEEWIKKLNPPLNTYAAKQTPEELREAKNAWKRTSERHHEYSREYSKNMSQQKRDAKNAAARERRANRTPEQIEADRQADLIRRPRKRGSEATV